MDANVIETEKRLLRIVDEVLEEYKPVVSALGFEIERSDEIERSSPDKPSTSEVNVSFSRLKRTELGYSTVVEEFFQVFLYLCGKPFSEKEIREITKGEMEISLKELQNL